MSNDTNGINSSNSLLVPSAEVNDVATELVNVTEPGQDPELVQMGQQFIQAVLANQANDTNEVDLDLQPSSAGVDALPADIRDRAITIIDEAASILDSVAQNNYSQEELEAILKDVIDPLQAAGILMSDYVSDELASTVQAPSSS